MQTNFSAARNRKRAILVVDDDAAVRRCMCLMLNMEGHRTIECGSAREALLLLALRAAEISAVVTDIDLPELNGIAFAGILARMVPDVPVLLVSGRTEPAAQEGMAFLAKPFGPRDLCERIHALLRPHHQEHLICAA